MEVLYGVPQIDSYEETRLLMEGLTLVQTLVEHCASVKVKRVFMFLAQNCKHAWAGKVDLSKVDVGRGKRALINGGHFDAKYQITVPTRKPETRLPEQRP
jgi:hypothetical protein